MEHSRPERERRLNIHFGARMRISRMLRGTSREKLAEHLATNTDRIVGFEKGEIALTPAEMNSIAKFLEIDVMSFYLPLADDPEMPSTYPTDRLLGPDGLDFFNDYLMLDHDSRMQVRKLVRQLTESAA